MNSLNYKLSFDNIVQGWCIDKFADRAKANENELIFDQQYSDKYILN